MPMTVKEMGLAVATRQALLRIGGMMKVYPVSMHRMSYRGANPKQRAKCDDYNRIAAAIEAYVNSQFADQPDGFVGSFFSYEIASAIREDAKTVAAIVTRTDGGSTGITMVKGKIAEPALPKQTD
jgi:hypothetical protein